jgi:hypothetical protein
MRTFLLLSITIATSPCRVATMPNVRRVILDRVGHVVNLEGADPFTGTIAKFLRSTAAIQTSTTSLTCHVRGPQEWLATRPSPLDSVTVTVGGATATICYSRPSARGRSVDSLVPLGKAWRVGANEPTTITLSGRLVVGGALLTAGRYVMLAVPGMKQWTVGFYTTPDTEPVKMFQSLKQVASGSGVVERVVNATEKFTIRVDPSGTTSDLLLEWGTWRVRIPVRPAS